MINRLATICLVATLLIAVGSRSVSAQEEKNATLKGIGAVAVVVENLPESAKAWA